MVEFAVIDDHGDQALTGSIAFSADTLDEVYEWAEGENYHSASIVKIYKSGKRKIIEGDEYNDE